MKTLFITTLFHIDIAEYLGRGDQIIQGVFICNDKEKAKSLISMNMEYLAGQIEMRTLVDSNAFVYAIKEIDQKHSSKIEPLILLNNYLEIVHSFFTVLWLIKDNSVNCELAFLETDYESRTSNVSSNALSSLYSDAKAQFCKTRFSREELRKARRFFTAFDTAKRDLLQPHNIGLMPIQNWDRISRVLFFLQAARTSSFLPSKIAHYCTCLETLFSTDAIEISHKISERVSHFLGSSADEKLTIYKNLKKAYSIRSIAVHGGNLPRGIKNVEDYSVLCDNYLRLCLQRILYEPERRKIFRSGNEELEKYFLNLVFSK